MKREKTVQMWVGSWKLILNNGNEFEPFNTESMIRTSIFSHA
jgi:hypothetical protein